MITFNVTSDTRIDWQKCVCYNYSTKSIQIAQLDLGIPIIDQSNCPINCVLFKLTVAADQPM